MRRKTNRLLLLLISTALAACSSQSERGSSGLEVESSSGSAAQPTYQAPEPTAAEPAYQPESAGVQYIDSPLPATPAAAPAPEAQASVPPSGAEQPADFPVTTYELPPEPELEPDVTAVDDLGPIGDSGESVSYAPAATPEYDSGISEPTVYADQEEAPAEVQTPVEDLGPIATSDETLSYAADPTPNLETGISEPDYPVEEAPATPAAITVSLDAEPLFNFDKHNIRADQRTKIDQFVAALEGTSYETVWAIGHADRIGTVGYNQKLSDRRAEAVKAYLVRLGVPANKIRTLGRSEHNPLTGETDCANLRRKELIACYQPDRRVEISVSGQKTAKAD
jgi:outer membrane protein OmpA-like peptidoglycan-associated protein